MRTTEGHGSGGHSERFRVEPEVVRAMGSALVDYGTQCGEARSYAAANLQLEGSGGAVMTSFIGWIYDLDGALSEFFTDLERVVGDSGTGLKQAAKLYEHLDHQAAVRLDREYWSH
jgi:hypothetical protein